ncbi:7 transmembrane receptor (rhodopsin family) [Nesidiocoris tenuis]|uniref:7 transmembrane receptor (Rhodopsin family) n=1 Tax=Nesidiocoris tenuis TaxID=355587 RepID=A0ABN7B605_9HEMI|nr:7 transmembrane receptor (rhodopsin family) [Nesidiocoris tenuis]
MIVGCILAVAINGVVLVSVCWIRRPLSPTLHFSLSLAGADVYTSILFATGLIVNSLSVILPKQFLPMHNDANIICYKLFLEGLRMGGIYTTLGHLLALAFNHYLGITKPLQYPSILTNRNISIVCFFLWVVPPGGLLTYCWLLEDDGFSLQAPGCDIKFIYTSEFRTTVSLVFFTSVSLIVLIYLHIYILVKRHQANRNRFRRVGSTYSRTGSQTERQQAQNRNEKAFWTTLIIVGSVILGFAPASLYFMLVCGECPVRSDWASPWVRIPVAFLNNFFIIFKTLINSYIYAARMHEIKNAIRRMRYSTSVKCCKLGSRDLNGVQSECSRNYLSRASTQRRSKKTFVCRLQSIPRHDGNCSDREAYSTPL